MAGVGLQSCPEPMEGEEEVGLCRNQALSNFSRSPRSQGDQARSRRPLLDLDLLVAAVLASSSTVNDLPQTVKKSTLNTPPPPPLQFAPSILRDSTLIQVHQSASLLSLLTVHSFP